MIQGYTHPMMFDREKRASNQSTGTEILSDYLRILLLSDKSEFLADPNYGCSLRSLIYNPNDRILVDQVKDSIVSAIQTYSPSIIVQFSDIDIVQMEDRMIIKISYILSDMSDRGLVDFTILHSEVQ